jgi:prepilin-type processing-associated H-X9-DG protein
VELLVEILVILSIVLFIIVPLTATWSVPKRADRIRCLSNLRQIGQALIVYAQNNKGAYPQVRHTLGAPLIKYTKPEATNPFAENGPVANDVTAAMFLLVRTTDLNPEVFVCPATNHDKDTLNNLPATSRSNFTSSKNLSYSFAHPYPDNAAMKMGNKLTTGVVADFAIGADRNECVNRYKSTDPNKATADDIKQMNSKNHEGDGQNVLFNDGHVEWCTSPFVGANRDHIYTRNGATSGDPMTHQPENPLDTILLPTEP